MVLTESLNYFGRYGYGMGYRMDPTIILALIGLVLTMIASASVNSTFAKFNKVGASCGMTGAMAAERVLQMAGIYDVTVQHIAGSLTDHYDPRAKVLRLSDSTYSSSSIAAICVAAHECGHAVQHKENYGPLVLRSTLVPAANIGSQMSWPIFLLGLVLSLRPLLYIGIICFCAAVLFQLVTLPVEFDASARALRILGDSNILTDNELKGGRKVLTAAAMTYVAALASSLLQLLRLILIARRNSRD